MLRLYYLLHCCCWCGGAAQRLVPDFFFSYVWLHFGVVQIKMIRLVGIACLMGALQPGSGLFCVYVDASYEFAQA